MTSPEFEAFLARLYVDADFRRGFLADPLAAAQRAGLSDPECQALLAINRQDLEIAASSFAAKRKKKPAATRRWWWPF